MYPFKYYALSIVKELACRKTQQYIRLHMQFHFVDTISLCVNIIFFKNQCEINYFTYNKSNVPLHPNYLYMPLINKMF